jgi:hypothetical protein
MALQDKPLRYSLDDLTPVENCFDRTHLRVHRWIYMILLGGRCGRVNLSKVLAAADSFMEAYPTNKSINVQFEQKITMTGRRCSCTRHNWKRRNHLIA